MLGNGLSMIQIPRFRQWDIMNASGRVALATFLWQGVFVLFTEVETNSVRIPWWQGCSLLCRVFVLSPRIPESVLLCPVQHGYYPFGNRNQGQGKISSSQTVFRVIDGQTCCVILSIFSSWFVFQVCVVIIPCPPLTISSSLTEDKTWDWCQK